MWVYPEVVGPLYRPPPSLGTDTSVAQLFCIPSLDVVRNVIQTYVFDKGDRVPCIGEAAAVNHDGNQQFLGRDPDIDGFR